MIARHSRPHIPRLHARVRSRVRLHGTCRCSHCRARHRVPRERVPAGSVGIAGIQTGVYPVESPGGWQLIGRTATVMFDPDRARPSLLAAGDLVGSCRSETPMSLGALQIIKPGLLTTVQDLGRYGHQARACRSPGRWMRSRIDWRISWSATIDAATLEVTLIGPELVVEADTTMAIAGRAVRVTCDGRPVPIGASFTVQRGQRLRFGRIVQGARAYLAVAGGVQSRAGPRKPRHAPGQPHGRIRRPGTAGGRPPADRRDPVTGRSRKSAGLTLPTDGRARLRVMPGPQADGFRPMR